MKNSKISPKEKALKLFAHSAKVIPAYKRFLNDNKINPGKVFNTGDFASIPLTDKKNYLLAFSRFELVPFGKFPAMISASSGSSGKPYYWPRGEGQEIIGEEMHRVILEDIFNLRGKRVLAIVCFSMGNWIAGTFTLASLRRVSEATNKFDLSVVTPGIDKDDILTTLKELAPSFDSVILIGYPPFIMDVVIASKEAKIDLKNMNLYFILAGENFSEKWRSVLIKLACITESSCRVVSIYGTADAGSIGYENPLTITLRKLAIKNKLFKKDFFGDMSFVPTVVSYDPYHTFFELVDGELVFTANSGIPLIRYNIKDYGSLYSYKEIMQMLKKHNLYGDLPYNLKKWHQPVIVLKGRKDVSVTFYALNIYPENFKAGLEDDRVLELVTGKYIANVKQVNNLREQQLRISVELKKGVRINSKIEQIIQKSLFDNLIKLNTEYRKLFSAIHTKAIPKVILVEYGSEQFVVTKSKHKWVKKPS